MQFSEKEWTIRLDQFKGLGLSVLTVGDSHKGKIVAVPLDQFSEEALVEVRKEINRVLRRKRA